MIQYVYKLKQGQVIIHSVRVLCRLTGWPALISLLNFFRTSGVLVDVISRNAML